jgi:hypothetical protein
MSGISPVQDSVYVHDQGNGRGGIDLGVRDQGSHWRILVLRVYHPVHCYFLSRAKGEPGAVRDDEGESFPPVHRALYSKMRRRIRAQILSWSSSLSLIEDHVPGHDDRGGHGVFEGDLCRAIESWSRSWIQTQRQQTRKGAKTCYRSTQGTMQ